MVVSWQIWMPRTKLKSSARVARALNHSYLSSSRNYSFQPDVSLVISGETRNWSLFLESGKGSHNMEEKKSVAIEKEEGPVVMVLTHNT